MLLVCFGIGVIVFERSVVGDFSFGRVSFRVFVFKVLVKFVELGIGIRGERIVSFLLIG